MATDEQARTVELPLTPAHVKALRHQIWSQRRWFLGTFAVAIAVGALAALLPDVRFWDVVSALSVAVGMTLAADWLFWRRPLAAAIRDGIYLRTTGPIRTSESPSAEADGSVRVGDVTIEHVPNEICRGLRDLPWGTVDYVPRVHAVLEQRDADGELLYR